MKYFKHFRHDKTGCGTETIFTMWGHEYYLDCILSYEFGDDIDKYVIEKERIIDKYGIKMTKYTITEPAVDALKKVWYILIQLEETLCKGFLFLHSF